MTLVINFRHINTKKMRLRSGTIIHPNRIAINITNIAGDINHTIYENRNKSLDCVLDAIKIYLRIIESNKERFDYTSKYYWIEQCNAITQLYHIMNEYYDDIYQEGGKRPTMIKLLNVVARKAIRFISYISHVYNKHSTPLMKYQIIGEFNDNEATCIRKCIKFLISYLKKSRDYDLLRII